MDRRYKKMDRIHVYQSRNTGKLLDVFEAQPFTRAGMDYYEYNDVMYPAFAYLTNDEVAYILLDRPLFASRSLHDHHSYS